MKRIATTAAMVVAVAATGLIASGDQGPRKFSEVLNGLKEAPAIVTTSGTGTFNADLSKDGTEIDYELTFNDLESNVTQAHIHIGYPQNAGGIVLWLCDSATVPVSPLAIDAARAHVDDPADLPQRIRVTRHADRRPSQSAARLLNGSPTWDEVVSLIRDGRTYANIHTATIPAPARSAAQIDSHDGHSGPGGGH